MHDSTKPWTGRRLIRREDGPLLTGKGRYVDDLSLPGMAYVAILRSPHAHARIVRIDSHRAGAQPGVLAVMTGEDVVRATKPFPMALPFLRRIVYHALAADRVRSVGEPLAAVVADDRLRAEDALELIDVEYEPLPVVMGMDAALGPGAPRIYDDWPDNVLTRREFSVGAVSEAFAAAEIRISDTFTSQRQTALPLELRGCIASWDRGVLTLWSSTQVPYIVRTIVAHALDIGESSIRVIAPDVGGGFGTKFQIFREEILVAFLARCLGRPVKWREDIREHLSASVHARDQRVTIALAAGTDGVLTALKVDVVGNVGTGAAWPSSYAPVMVLATSFALGLKVQNFSYRYTCVVSNTCPTGAYRGFGNPIRVFALERALDMLAARTGLDPAEIRRRNLIPSSEMPFRAATGARMETGTMVEAMDRALVLVDYPRVRREQAAARGQGRYIGIGIASFAEGTAPSFAAQGGMFGGYDSCVVRVAPDGTITVQVGISPQGQGHETMIAQVVADVLGVTPDDVIVRHSDTALAAFGLGAWGSRSAITGSSASFLAAAKVKEKVLAIGAHLLEAHVSDLRLSNRGVKIAGVSDRSISLREVAQAAYAGRSRLPADMEPGLEGAICFEPSALEVAPDAQGRAMRYATIANAAHVAVVEVDVDTGMLTFLDYVVVHDCGTVINPMIVDGQIRGGVAQGIAGVLHEHLTYDDAGQLLTGTLMDYHVPKATDVPNIRIEHLESPDPTVPTGAKGVGEGGTIGAPAAIANAVTDALAPFGVNVTHTLLTPPEVLRLINEARGRTATGDFTRPSR